MNVRERQQIFNLIHHRSESVTLNTQVEEQKSKAHSKLQTSYTPADGPH